MGYAKAAVEDISGEIPTESKIWKSTKHKDVTRSIRYFLWMLLHDGYKVGRYWDKIPNLDALGTCSKCGVKESMEHILTRCDAPGQREVWELVSELWVMKTGEELAVPTIGQIMTAS